MTENHLDLTSAFYPQQIRKHIFLEKQSQPDDLLFILENADVQPNINFSNNLENLLSKSYLNALSNFDLPFIKDLQGLFGNLLENNEIHMLFSFTEETLANLILKNSYLKDLLATLSKT